MKGWLDWAILWYMLSMSLYGLRNSTKNSVNVLVPRTDRRTSRASSKSSIHRCAAQSAEAAFRLHSDNRKKERETLASQYYPSVLFIPFLRAYTVFCSPRIPFIRDDKVTALLQVDMIRCTRHKQVFHRYQWKKRNTFKFFGNLIHLHTSTGRR